MDRRIALVLLLVSLLALTLGGGMWRAWILLRATVDTGPHALVRDGNGGFFLATGMELLHLDAGGAVRDRHTAAALGLAGIDAMAPGEGSTLWVHDHGHRRLFRCDTQAWSCRAASDEAIALGARVELAWLYGRERRLLAIDSAQQRLLAFDAEGQLLPLPAQQWRAPRQLSTAGGEVLLAEAGARRIVSIDPIANQPGATALDTQAAPVRFLRRDSQWWVLEGAASTPLRLRHYQAGVASEVRLPARDPVALLDGGRAGLLLASRDDWCLLAITPETGEVGAFGSPMLQEEFRSRARARLDAQSALVRLPWVVLPLVALTLLPIPLLLWQSWRASRSAAITVTPAPLTRTLERDPDGRAVRIDTRRDLLVPERAQQERQFKWLLGGAALLLAMAVLANVLWPSLRDNGSAWVVTAVIAIVPLFVLGHVIAARRQEDRLYDRHLVCGPGKVVLIAAGKPVMAVTYDAVWLGEHSLVLGSLRLPLYQGRGASHRPVWDLDALEATLAPRLPAGRRLGELALGRALLAQGRWCGLIILVEALPYPLTIPFILMLLLEYWKLLVQGFINLMHS